MAELVEPETFSWSSNKSHFLLDPHNIDYLELDKSILAATPKQFEEYLFYNSEAILNSTLGYCYENWMFAAKIILGVDLLPFQGVTLDELFTKNFTILVATRGFSKSFLLAVYALLKAIFYQGSKIVIVSASFRQSKIVFEYIKDIYKRSPVLQQLCGNQKPRTDITMCYFDIGNSKIVSVPLGDGEKIRGLRSDTTLIDEFGSINEAVFQIVVRGFSIVSQDPVAKVKTKQREKKMIEVGIDVSQFKEENEGNQIVLSGTAKYQFNHFFAWVEKYKKIISCGTDMDKRRKMFGDEMSESELLALNPEQFSVMQVPYTALPEGFMDENTLAQGRATMTKAHFSMEFLAEFFKDSDGFFPRSLLEALCAYKKYTVLLSGEKGKRYIMGIDPARQSDHFAIVIFEIDDVSGEDKIVYVWATNEKKMKKTGEVNEHQTYYGACAKKIRQLLKRFNVAIIMMDAGGGGREVANYLQEKTFLVGNEKPVWNMDDPTQRLYAGLHILKLIDSTSQWISDANHSMKKSLEEFQLLLPVYDTVAIEKELNTSKIAAEASFGKAVLKQRLSMTDTIEDVSEEIEETKNELSNIVITATPTGKEHFDLPKLTTPGQQKMIDRRRKDRYSACVLAHWGLQFVTTDRDIKSNYEVSGGIAGDLAGSNIGGELYRGLPAGTQYATSDVVVMRKGSGGKVSF